MDCEQHLKNLYEVRKPIEKRGESEELRDRPCFEILSMRDVEHLIIKETCNPIFPSGGVRWDAGHPDPPSLPGDRMLRPMFVVKAASAGRGYGQTKSTSLMEARDRRFE